MVDPVIPTGFMLGSAVSMGGTYDPETGKIVWELRVPVEEQVAFYRAHPPRALDGLTARPVELPDHPFDGHGEPVNVAFELGCECGCATFCATGWVNDDDEIGPPVTLYCDACEREHEIFDPARHGYDAEISEGASEDTEGHPDDFPEPDPPYGVIVRFELASDVLGDDEWKGREQEVFTWITIVARSPDGTLTTLLDWECA